MGSRIVQEIENSPADAVGKVVSRGESIRTGAWN